MATWQVDQLANAERRIEKYARTADDVPKERLAHRLVSLCEVHGDAACLYYAAGRPLDTVRQHLLESARHFEAIVERRDEARAGNLEEVSPPYYAGGFVEDFSAVNSALSMTLSFYARLGGDTDLAPRLAAAIWDPDKPKYMALKPGKYVVLTVADQQLAYAYREYLAGNAEAVGDHLARVRTLDETVRAERELARAVTTPSSETFCERLDDSLALHTKLARRPAYKTNPRHLLAVRPLGWTQLALQANIVDLEQLPSDHPYFPVGLLEHS